MDFQTCPVELEQVQFYPVVTVNIAGTVGNCPSDLLAWCVRSLWNITREKVTATLDTTKIRKYQMHKK